jgi:proline dehydrogenase
MEDCSLTDITLTVLKNILNSSEFKNYPGFGFVIQAYLKRSISDIDQVISWANIRNTPIKIRLVKGAYWDSEYILSKQANWPCPVYLKKESTDASYEIITKKLIDAGSIIYPAFASHNIRSICHAICYANEVGRKNNEYETQFLYGMGDEFKDILISKGIIARDYTPVGELLPGMAYLVRRLLENTANEGFLRQVNFDKIDPLMLFRKPNLGD